jgi:hypothetical protein
VMTYTLNSGIKNTIPLSSKQIGEWIDCYKKGIRYVTIIGEEYFGINPSLVADWKVHNEYSEQRTNVEAIKTKSYFQNEEIEEAYNSRIKINAKVDCKKCLTIYACELSHKIDKTTCTKCKSEVYLDVDKGIIFTGKGNGYLYTNTKEII